MHVSIEVNRNVYEWWRHFDSEKNADILDLIGKLQENEKDKQISNLFSQCEELKMINNLWKNSTQNCKMQCISVNDISYIVTSTILCNTENLENDRILVSAKNGMNLLIQTKDTNNLQYNDITEFRKDIYENASKTRINAALFISLNTKNIPNTIGEINIEYMNINNTKIPILLLASNNVTCLQVAINSLHELYYNISSESLDNEILQKEHEHFQKILPQIFSYVHELENSIIGRIEILQRLLDDTIIERSKQKDILISMMKLQQNITWLNPPNDEAQAINIVNAWFDKKGEFPRTSDMTLTQRSLIKNAGGLKHVIELTKKQKLN